MVRQRIGRLSSIIALAAISGVFAADELPSYDFSKANKADWRPSKNVTNHEVTRDGLVVSIGGIDPYLDGPPRDFPSGMPLYGILSLRSEEGGVCQIFYYKRGATEKDSVRVSVNAGEQAECRFELPPLGSGYRFRIDPPGSTGKAFLKSLRFEKRVPEELTFPKPLCDAEGRPIIFSGFVPHVESNDLQINLFRFGGDGKERWTEFPIHVDREKVALLLVRQKFAYSHKGKLTWVQFDENTEVKVSPLKSGRDRMLVLEYKIPDPDGGTWTLQQAFLRNKIAGAIDVSITLSVDQERMLNFFPALVLLPGAQAFGSKKTQGLFSGVEYLDHEPSSSEADVIGPGSKRRLPDPLKITMPLMAIAAEDRYVGLIWNEQPHVSAFFDSPDRTFNSEAHAIGLILPGADPNVRAENNLLPFHGKLLAPKEKLTVTATIIGGKGESVVDAIKKYVELRGLPDIPLPPVATAGYVKLAAAGWLDSQIREGEKFRHAAWPGFGASKAADPALYMKWLSDNTEDEALRKRLNEATEATLKIIAPAHYNFANIGHIVHPLASLVFGHTAENMATAAAHARGSLGRFEGEIVPYKPGKVNYGKTHFAPDANGLTAQVVASSLEHAAFCGDNELITAWLKKLDTLDKFKNTVPRGAQTWEVPLHTPDILASAHLVHAYTLGYELTGDKKYLESAKHWAWTGVPFVYLRKPANGDIGPYATTPVLGATSWEAPLWIGLPVQWCGMVYADALYRLAQYDEDGIWKKLADGITVSGIQQSWPITDKDRAALLPDSFVLRIQKRDGPPINPGTVQACAMQFYSGKPTYGFRVAMKRNLRIHAPGPITQMMDRPDITAFTVDGWPSTPYEVVVNGFKARPKVKIDGREIAPEYLEKEGAVILKMEGKGKIEIY